MGRHDSSYRLLFSHARMVRDLLREILGESWVGLLDLASAEKVPLAKLEASDSPVADLFRLERSAAWDEMIAGVSRVRQHVGPDEESLRHAFEALLEGVVLPRLGLGGDEIPARMSLEEVETMLAERIDEWNRKLAEESRQEGRHEGRHEGRQEGRQEGLQKGLQKGRQEGRREGLNEGRKEGEAQALVRLLEKKFGVLPKGVQKRITGAERDLLLEWFDRAVTAERLEAVFRDS